MNDSEIEGQIEGHRAATARAHAEREHHENVHGALEEEHRQVQVEIASHTGQGTTSRPSYVSLPEAPGSSGSSSSSGSSGSPVVPDVPGRQMPASAPAGFHFLTPPRTHPGTIDKASQLDRAQLQPNSMISRIGVDDSWVHVTDVPDFLFLLDDPSMPGPSTRNLVRTSKLRREEELLLEADWRHTVVGGLSHGQIRASPKWKRRHLERLGLHAHDIPL